MLSPDQLDTLFTFIEVLCQTIAYGEPRVQFTPEPGLRALMIIYLSTGIFVAIIPMSTHVLLSVTIYVDSLAYG